MTRTRRTRRACGTAAFVAILLGAGLAGRAQQVAEREPPALAAALPAVWPAQKPAPPTETPRHTGIRATLRSVPYDFKHLFSRENLMWVGIGSGAALAIHPVDDNINRHFAGAGAADKFFKPGKYIGQTGTLVATSLTVYAVGRMRDQPKVSHIGMDLLRALILDEALTQSMKYAAQRERPDGSDSHSFPSGHASTTFAVATVLERHSHWKLVVPGYLFASYVAMSRLHENKHFASDVVFGATVGIISGRTVTRPGSDKYGVAVVPTHGGVAFMVTRRPAR